MGSPRTVGPRNDESTRLKAARPDAASRELRLVTFWRGGSASYDLPAGARLVVGRADDSDVRIPDDSVSRRHAAVHGGRPARIEDLGSANGTIVGDHRILPNDPVIVAPSTVVEVGDALIVVRAVAPDEPRSEATSAAEQPTLDPAMARVEELVGLVAPTPIGVLVLGETGVGKGLVAETIHRRSPRAAGPFVRVNCAALAETLLESELFGHERGAFTGALQSKPGLLEAANGGTILLDEVGDMPAATQAKILHAVEHNEVMRVGSIKPRSIDVRFIAATNRDLQELVAEGQFRQDLYFRLNGMTIRVPPLRERRLETPSLARAFVAEACVRMGRPPATLTDEAMRLLLSYEWPGNVRELRNAMVRAALFAQKGRIGVEHFEIAPSAAPASHGAGGSGGKLRSEVRELERKRILDVLERCGNNQVAAAKALGIARGTLRSRMKDLGLLAPAPARRRK
jgi:DNA-binding NtrC family response regulator